MDSPDNFLFSFNTVRPEKRKDIFTPLDPMSLLNQFMQILRRQLFFWMSSKEAKKETQDSQTLATVAIRLSVESIMIFNFASNVFSFQIKCHWNNIYFWWFFFFNLALTLREKQLEIYIFNLLSLNQKLLMLKNYFKSYLFLWNR